MGKDGAVSDDSTNPSCKEATSSSCLKRNRDLFDYLLTTFQAMLPAEKAAQFQIVAQELGSSVDDNCQSCRLEQRALDEVLPHDPRRSRFLLRLVVSRVTPLFSGKTTTLPRSLIDGLDRYLNKAFGQVIYDELNAETNQMLHNLHVEDDEQMWNSIRKNPQWRRFADTIFIRILLRFENFALGKKTFMHIVDFTMQEQSRFNFTEEHFFMVFEALFSELWKDLQDADRRLRWDFAFGDGAAKRLDGILAQGLVHWLRRKDSKVLGSGRVVAEKVVAKKK